VIEHPFKKHLRLKICKSLPQRFLPKFQTSHLVQKHDLLILMGDTQSWHAIIIPAHSSKLPEICLPVFFSIGENVSLSKNLFQNLRNNK